MLKYLSLLILVFIYLGFRLQQGLGWGIWLLLAFIFLGLVFYPSQWLRKSHLGIYQHLYRWIVYIDIGFICMLFCLVLARDLIFFPARWMNLSWAHYHVSAESSWTLIILAVALVCMGLWTALSGPRVKNVKIPIKDLPQGLEGYRIAQISDLHVGPTIGSRYVKKVVRKVNEQAPHLTVLTGDIVDGDADHHLGTISHLRGLNPSGQVLFVTGNHEYYWDGPRWIQEFENLGFHVLQNSHRKIVYQEQEILVAGVLDPSSKLANPQHKPDIKKALKNSQDSKVKILLAHQPSIAKLAAAEGFDLLLSGHTHAGQFFPFTLLIFSVHEFVKGLKACGQMWVYVNQGTGYWGPPLRIGTFTEITLLELTNAN